MLCERCRSNPATAILTQTINGRTVTEHLCAECAYLSGFTSLFNGFPFGEKMNAARMGSAAQKRCPACGVSLEEIVDSGKIGCAECYRTFRQELMPTIQNIHGKAIHAGKHPKAHLKEIPERIEQLKNEMQEAVSQENFETAAKIRDEIRRLSDASKE